MKFDLHIFGEVLYDVIGSDKILGGAPFNVAWNLKMLGLNPAFISAVGDDDLGEKIIKNMKKISLSTKYIQKNSFPTGVVEVILENGSPQYEIKTNTAYDFITTADINSVELLYLGSLALRGNHSRESAMELKKRSKRVFVDINLRAPHYNKEIIKELLAEIDILKINSDELEEIKKYYNFRDEIELFDMLDLEILIITKAKEGSLLIYRGQRFEAEAKEVDNFRDSVGAGDAYASMFIYSLLNKIEIETALEYSSIFASKICSIDGATLMDREFYQNIKNEIGI